MSEESEESEKKCVTALGDSVRQAQQRALDVVRQIGFDGAQWRGDIGHRAIRH